MEKNNCTTKSTLIYAVYIVLFVAAVFLVDYVATTFRIIQSNTFEHVYYIYTLALYIIFGIFIAADRLLAKNVSKIPKFIIRAVAIVFLILVFILPFFSITLFISVFGFHNSAHYMVAVGYLLGAAVIDFIAEKSDKPQEY